MYNDLTDRKYRTKVNDSFSNFIALLLGIHQSWILGPLLFTIYICDIFFFVEEGNVTTYAHDNSIFKR